MCLRLPENAKQQVAQKNIPVYKVLRKTYTGFQTPFMYHKVPLNGKLKTRNRNIPVNDGYISEGAIHSYKDLKEAVELDREMLNSIIAEAIIPKGARYYISENGKEYASTSLYLIIP